MLMLSPSVEMGIEREMNMEDFDTIKSLGEGIYPSTRGVR